MKSINVKGHYQKHLAQTIDIEMAQTTSQIGSTGNLLSTKLTAEPVFTYLALTMS